MPLIDALKGIAAQLIVLHHLASYGALARAAEQFAPQTIDWLYGYGRIVVQVFLVVAGFLAARGLAPQGTPAVIQPAGMIWQRYVRLIVPFLFAVAIAVVSAALARVWMQDEFIPALPNIWQFLAHGLLLNGALGVPSLSAGIWYVAIDLQLYALLVLLLWLASRFSADGVIRGRVALALVAVLAGFALFFFNRNPDYDLWGLYFFGSYALGAFAYWGSQRKQMLGWMLLMTALTIAALLVDFRLRIGVALMVALLLATARYTGWLERWPSSSLPAFLGRISYSVFLIHFPVCLLMNAVFVRFLDGTVEQALAVFLLAWLISTLAGWLFYRHVECRQFTWSRRAHSSGLGRFIFEFRRG
ncbi:MAG: acyltransferase [Zoogloeaceae bacterium]|nr:acyltransferase [Zoogloeaceae bacterium]